MTDPKHTVTMRNPVLVGTTPEGHPIYQDQIAVDHVPASILDTYLADARTRWYSVTANETPDPDTENGA